MRHISAATDALAVIVKGINYTELWDAELAWYFPSPTHWICLLSLDQIPEF